MKIKAAWSVGFDLCFEFLCLFLISLVGFVNLLPWMWARLVPQEDFLFLLILKPVLSHPLEDVSKGSLNTQRRSNEGYTVGLGNFFFFLNTSLVISFRSVWSFSEILHKLHTLPLNPLRQCLLQRVWTLHWPFAESSNSFSAHSGHSVEFDRRRHHWPIWGQGGQKVRRVYFGSLNLSVTVGLKYERKQLWRHSVLYS